MHFSHAVSAIQSLVGLIKNVHIVYSDKDPLNVDLVINLTSDGIRLAFDPIKQRLKTVEVYDLSLLRLKYGDILFNCPDVSPTIEQIDQSFGATHPGVYDDDKRVFTLTFRGLTFEFPAKSPFQPSYDSIRPKLGRLQFPPGESPRVSRLSIYCGSNLNECTTPPIPTPRYPSLNSEGVEVLRRNRHTLGLRVRLISVPPINKSESGESASAQNNPNNEGEESGNGNGGSAVRDVLFGDTVQDVVAALGAPARIFYKSEDKMKIHSPKTHRKSNAQKSDYFYNYFTL